MLHPFLMFLPALVFFLLPVLPAIARRRRAARKERERVRAAANKQAAPKIDRAEAMRAVTWLGSAPAPKRGPGRPRKHPAPDPDARKRKPGRPRKAAPAQRPEIISSPAPAEDLAKLASENLYTPEEFLKHIS